MRIVGTKIELVLDGNEQLIHLKPSFQGNFNTYHHVSVNSDKLTMPSMPRPVRIKAVILLVEEMEPVQS